MGLYEFVNYVVYDNPVSKGVKSLVVPNTVPTIPPQTVTVITETKPLWKLASENGPFVRLAGLFGASAVALGAYGAHRSYPKDRADELKPIFETGNRYHFLHTLALLGIPLCKNPKLSGSLIILGTTLFSGACYYHAFTGDNKFGKLAPVGGTILIVGWLTMIL
ncbi:transmembrane protein 256 homolog isoform X1 [Tenebrio molitor]|jgi:uncharacterized membrane protein YgdD (TMEM256/DUF423 family)|uniref:transmembrane protein 256 homolog isoform X1 n=1 Tax=Tenebrio molitor TaxID=7067 RepID=UPI0036248F34